MPATKSRSNKQAHNGPAAKTPVSAASAEVLTLSEAAAYLRVAEDEVLRLVHTQDLPGRNIGTQWRFLRSSLQDWLRSPPPRPSKEALKAVIGSWKDDPELESYLRRGLP